MYRPLQIRANTLNPKEKRHMKNNWNMFVTTYHTKQSVLWRFSSTLLWDISSMDPVLILLYTRLKMSTALTQHVLWLKYELIWIGIWTIVLTINEQMVLESNNQIKTEVLQMSRSEKRYTKFWNYGITERIKINRDNSQLYYWLKMIESCVFLENRESVFSAHLASCSQKGI